jgi:hypothetical protein
MLIPQYPLSADESYKVFQFISIGKKGRIFKIVKFEETEVGNVYNLGFGDLDVQTGDISDIIVSDNGDSEVVLSTVAACVRCFIDQYPNSEVYATGSTSSRTRLYRMGIAKHLEEIQEDFEIFGLIDNEFRKFERGKNYQGFLVRRRK